MTDITTRDSSIRRVAISTFEWERLKAIQRIEAIAGSAPPIQVKLYKILGEEEYLALKAKGKENVKVIVVDDAGLVLCAGKEVQEEDWDEDDFGSDGEERCKRKTKKESATTVPGSEKQAATYLSAAAALLNSRRIPI